MDEETRQVLLKQAECIDTNSKHIGEIIKILQSINATINVMLKDNKDV